MEAQGFVYATRIISYIKAHEGQYLRDTNNVLHILLEGRRIPLNFNRDNYSLAGLVLAACHVSTLSPAAQAAIQRLQVHAATEASRIALRQFSAVSQDGARLYLPLADGKLLQVSESDISLVPNGKGEDAIWLEHPTGDPLQYTSGDTAARLANFERLIVNTQACRIPEMRWFVAMNEALFPFVRDLSPARLILVHIGRSQQGKTTGAGRFVILLGLGDVLGDFTVAALGNAGDLGLLVLDNKEQSNLSPSLIEFLLYVSTGAKRGRATSEGALRLSSYRPAVVITSIEGLFRSELRRRSVEIEYDLGSSQPTRRGLNEGEIRHERHGILSALVLVLQRFFQIRRESRPTPSPIPEFSEHFTILADLLRAYADIAGKPTGWAEDVIQAWAANIKPHEPEESELEQPLLRLTQEARDDFDIQNLSWSGREGELFVTDATRLLSALQRLSIPHLSIPRTSVGLGHRLRSDSFQAIQVLDERTAPNVEPLRRQGRRRLIGLFVPNDSYDSR
ncbi:MAG TPA: hypothetical protein VFE22_15720 [Edaphobacter sp.]|nr:hypothetical protein [Edaphobacter sp.]